MRGSNNKQLSSILLSVAKNTSKNSASKSTKVDIKTLKELVPPLDSSHHNIPTSQSFLKSSRVSSKAASHSKKSTSRIASKSTIESSTSQISLHRPEGSEQELLKAISSLLCGSGSKDLGSRSLPALEDPNEEKSLEKILDIPWFSNTSQTRISQHRKGISRERKQKWIFKKTQTRRFERLVTMCGDRLGTITTLEVFGKLGRETGVKEYNVLIGLCIEKARMTQDEDVSLDYIHKAFQLFIEMKEQGFQLEEETYGLFLMYLIDMGMEEEFHFFTSVISDKNPGTLSRLGYYEMLLWISVGNDDKVQELCNSVGVDCDGDRLNLAESYLLALCENDRKKELLQLLQVVDITRVSSMDYVLSIFKSLGRLSLENIVEKFILAFKITEVGAENISHIIYNYAISIPNLVVEDVIVKFKNLHEKLEVAPSSTSYEKLITYCCDSFEVHEALDIVNQMCQMGLAPSIEIFNPILHAIEENCELDLLHPIYSVICRHNLKPNGETFRSMINLCVRMKDFEGAYKMLIDLKKMDLMPTANMYNAIMAGYFREKNVSGALMVLNQMKRADVKPDSQTFSCLICNCDCEEDIIKYHEELQCSGVQATKHVYMALINAYVNCGQFEKAKQVVLDQGIVVKNINEIKSSLVSALASCGQMSDALEVHEGIKKTGGHLEPKAIISLIEHLQSEGELDRLLQLLGELNEHDFWFDGCRRVVLYCIRHRHLSYAIDLLKQLKYKDEMSIYAVFDQVFCQISETEPISLEFGLDVLQAIKDELKLRPSRTSLDFLLNACITAKDSLRASSISEEYQKAGLPFNVLTYLRMYQVRLASGDNKGAKKLLKEIPKDDPHVLCIINACNKTYCNSKPIKGKKVKKGKKK